MEGFGDRSIWPRTNCFFKEKVQRCFTTHIHCKLTRTEHGTIKTLTVKSLNVLYCVLLSSRSRRPRHSHTESSASPRGSYASLCQVSVGPAREFGRSCTQPFTKKSRNSPRSKRKTKYSMPWRSRKVPCYPPSFATTGVNRSYNPILAKTKRKNPRVFALARGNGFRCLLNHVSNVLVQHIRSRERKFTSGPIVEWSVGRERHSASELSGRSGNPRSCRRNDYTVDVYEYALRDAGQNINLSSQTFNADIQNKRVTMTRCEIIIVLLSMIALGMFYIYFLSIQSNKHRSCV